MPSNLRMKRAPFLALGNFIRNLGLQKGKKGPLGGRVGFKFRGPRGGLVGSTTI